MRKSLPLVRKIDWIVYFFVIAAWSIYYMLQPCSWDYGCYQAGFGLLAITNFVVLGPLLVLGSLVFILTQLKKIYWLPVLVLAIISLVVTARAADELIDNSFWLTLYWSGYHHGAEYRSVILLLFMWLCTAGYFLLKRAKKSSTKPS